MLLIHVPKITARVSYIFKHVCRRILGIDVSLTFKIEQFIAHQGPKFSYGKQPLSKELYFQSVDLLFQHGLNEVDIQVSGWEETKCFFEVKSKNAALPYDIFAASFFLLSRYEEYLPHVKDDLGRFPPTQSLAYVHDFLQDPVVDIWAYKLKEVLNAKFPNLMFNQTNFSISPIIVVKETFVYKNRGFLRSLGGSMRDLWKLRLDKVTDRFKVNFGFKRDPYDTFDEIIALQKSKRQKSKVLFGLGEYSSLEKNISYNNATHRILIKHISDYLNVGLRISYEAIRDLTILKTEKQRIEGIVNRKLRYSICSFFKLKLPEAYRNFIELEIEEDYSMGYKNFSGFRAGTCVPFMFYDLDYEVQTPLMVYSFCCTPKSFKNPQSEQAIKQELDNYIEKIKKVNGMFIPVFSNSLFGEPGEQIDWKSVVEYIWNKDENRKN